jgi:aminocarboxymuconate-semialdehyde decarboxylase
VRKEMPVIDIHSHMIPPGIVEAIEREPTTFAAQIKGAGTQRSIVHQQGYTYPLFEEFIHPETKLAVMEQKGLDISVISPAPPLFYYWADKALGVRVARLVNDGIAELVASHPQHLQGMASVPMQDTEAAIAELERVVSTYGFRGVEIGTTIEGESLAHPRFRPFFRRAAELDVLVFTHPYYVGSKQGMEDYYLTNLIGNPFDTTIMLAHLFFSGMLDELPTLKLCIAHAGGFAPYQIGRLAHGYNVRAETHANARTSPLELLRRLTFDTLTFYPPALRYLIDLVGANHIMLGSDAPFDMGDSDPVGTVTTIPALNEQERTAILTNTAVTMLGITAS